VISFKGLKFIVCEVKKSYDGTYDAAKAIGDDSAILINSSRPEANIIMKN